MDSSGTPPPGPGPSVKRCSAALPVLTGSYPLVYVALMTAILIFSSVTMVLAVEAGHRMDKKGRYQMALPHRARWRLLRGLAGLGMEPLHPRQWRLSPARMAPNTGCTTTHDTHDPAHAPGFHLVKAVPGHYLQEGGRCPPHRREAAMTSGTTGWVCRRGQHDPQRVQPAQYANFFFFITGFHGFHVFSGVVINFIVC